MKVVCISDTHEIDLGIIPDGDVLIHSGDFSRSKDTLLALELLNEEFKKLPHEHKILVAGNHDWCLENNYEEAVQIFTEGTVLINKGIEIDGIKFYGTPDQPTFYNWAFNRTTEQLIESYSKIPNDTDVLITHTPPYGILDTVLYGGEHVGSRELLDRVMDVKPKVHVFGHIHESYGREEHSGIRFINAALVDHRYMKSNEPIVFEVESK